MNGGRGILARCMCRDSMKDACCGKGAGGAVWAGACTSRNAANAI